MAEGAEVVDQNADTSTTTEDKETQQTDKTSTQDRQPDQKPAEDARYRGLVADLQKERKARQEYERRVTERERELELERKRVQRLAGIEGVSDDEAERDEVKRRFAELFPHQAALTQEDLEAIRSYREEREIAPWREHGSRMLGAVEKEIAKEMGGDLTPRQISRIRAAYKEEATYNADFLDRHERGDKTLVTEFAKDWIDDWYKPAQRKAAERAAGSTRPVPNGRDRTATTQPEKPIDVNDSKAVEDALVRGFIEKGGEFGRRRIRQG